MIILHSLPVYTEKRNPYMISKNMKIITRCKMVSLHLLLFFSLVFSLTFKYLDELVSFPFIHYRLYFAIFTRILHKNKNKCVAQTVHQCVMCYGGATKRYYYYYYLHYQYLFMRRNTITKSRNTDWKRWSPSIILVRQITLNSSILGSFFIIMLYRIECVVTYICLHLSIDLYMYVCIILCVWECVRARNIYLRVKGHNITQPAAWPHISANDHAFVRRP